MSGADLTKTQPLFSQVVLCRRFRLIHDGYMVVVQCSYILSSYTQSLEAEGRAGSWCLGSYYLGAGGQASV